MIEPGEDPFASAAPADVVLLEPGCVVTVGWLDALREAALATSTTATAAAVTQRDLDPALELDAVGFEEAAAAIRSAAPRLRPRLADHHEPACLYVRRSAIELVGWGETFLRRCLETGLVHVLADDVLVLDARPSSDRPPALDDGRGPVGRSLGSARRALSGLSAVIDAGILYGPTTGSAVHVLELIAGLARTGKVSLTVIVPNRPSEYALGRLQPLPEVSLITYGEAPNQGRLDPPTSFIGRFSSPMPATWHSSLRSAGGWS